MVKSPEIISKRPDFLGDNNFHMRINPEVDVLTDILMSFELRGSVFCRSVLKSPWSLGIPDDGQAHFHYIDRGMCHLEIEGHPHKYTLEHGDLVVLPHGSGHRLYHGEDHARVSIVELVEKTPKKEACQLVQFGGNGVETRMLCGAFQFSALRDGFLKPILPETIILSYRANESHNLLESTLRLILIEASHNLPGAEMILSNLVGILLVQVLRAWIDRKAATQKTHWLKALKDKRIATALSCIHTQPEYKWTVAKLAASANMSRSPFAARFKLLVGETPMSYLGKWRMIRATRMLEDTNLGLSEIASSVGYQSMPSFSKTFKKITGYAPGQWRAKTPSVTDGAIINYHPFDER